MSLQTEVKKRHEDFDDILVDTNDDEELLTDNLEQVDTSFKVNEIDIDDDSDDSDDSDDEDEEPVEEEKALLVWLLTFPQINEITSEENFFRSWSVSDDISRALVNVTMQIYSNNNNSIPSALKTNDSSEESWAKMRYVTGVAKTEDEDEFESRLSVLRTLLFHAVSEKCKDKNKYISSILELDNSIQMSLMQIIESCKISLENKVKETTKEEACHSQEDKYLDGLDYNEKSLLDDDDDNELDCSMHPSSAFNDRGDQYTHNDSTFVYSNQSFIGTRNDFIARSSSLPSSSSNRKNKSFSIEIEQLEKDIELLKQQNESKSKEIVIIQQKESHIRSKLEEAEARYRAEKLESESEALRRESDLKAQIQERELYYSRKLQNFKTLEENATRTKEQLEIIKDENDILKHSQEKLLQAEEHNRRLQDKLEVFNDLKLALSKQENAHNHAMEKCLSLETEVASLRPLKRQLDDYKNRTTDVELELAERKDDLEKANREIARLNSCNEQLQINLKRYQDESEEMKHRLESDVVISTGSKLNSVGIEVSELNPELNDELLHLRQENKRLKAFAAKRENDSVQLMEEKLDDSDRLASKFKENYFSTKDKLEETTDKLKNSLEREESLKHRLTVSEEFCKKLGDDLQSLHVKHQKSLIERERNLQSTKKRLKEQHATELETTEKKLNSKLEEVLQNSKAILDKTTGEMEESNQKLKDSHKKILNELSINHKKDRKEMEAKIQKITEESELKIKQLLDISAKERDKLVLKGKDMIKDTKEQSKKRIEELENTCKEKISSISKEMESKSEIFEENMKKITKRMGEYKHKLHVGMGKYKQAKEEIEGLGEKLKKKEKEIRNLKNENERFRRQIGGTLGSDSVAQTQFSKLQLEFNHLLEENRDLKKNKGSIQSNFSKYLENDPSPSHLESNDTVVSHESYGVEIHSRNKALSDFRQEYEEKIAELTDQKRELIMRNAASTSDARKEMQRSQELEQKLERVKNENTSLQLQLERAGRLNIDVDTPRLNSPTKRIKTDEATNIADSHLFVDKGKLTSPAKLLIASNAHNSKMKSYQRKPLSESFNNIEKETYHLFPSKPHDPGKIDENLLPDNFSTSKTQRSVLPNKNEHKSLLELTKQSGVIDSNGNQECQQS